MAEIVGRYLPYLWLKKAGPIWLLGPAALSLAVGRFVLMVPRHTEA